jgi:hypothetical protein
MTDISEHSPSKRTMCQQEEDFCSIDVEGSTFQSQESTGRTKELCNSPTGQTNHPTIAHLLVRQEHALGHIKLNACHADKANQNLTASQEKLLKKHFCREYLSEPTGQKFLRGGVLGDASIQANSQHPKCPSYQFEIGRRCLSLPEVTKSIPAKERNLKSENMLPGKTVSVIHKRSTLQIVRKASRRQTVFRRQYLYASCHWRHTCRATSVVDRRDNSVKVLLRSTHGILPK